MDRGARSCLAGRRGVVVRDRGRPATLAVGVLGGVLAAVGAWDLGPTWLAAALAVESVAAGIAASRSEGDRRLLLQVVCGGLAAAAWIQTATAIGWSREESLRATALVAGGQFLLAASVARLRLLAPDWVLRAGALAAVGVGAVGYSTLPQMVLAGDPAAHGVLAGAFAMAAVAAGISATPCELPRLREVSGVLVAAGLGEALRGPMHRPKRRWRCLSPRGSDRWSSR